MKIFPLLHRVYLPVLATLGLAALLLANATSAYAQGNVANGLYLSKAAGCVGCHTINKAGSTPFAGGRALETPFGTFYGPNITPDKETGLGNWSEADFKRAIRQGERRDGSHYFPAFPYPSFTGMSDADIQDLWAYMRTVPPTKQANREHDLRFPFNLRLLVTGWKLLFFTPGPVAQPATMPAPVVRGAYLVGVLGHCGECHTPRNALGGPDKSQLFGGAKIPEGKVPNLTPTRLKKWSDADLTEYLKTGNAPNGDVVVEPMSEVITNTTSKLSAADLAAVVAYLRTLPPRDEPK
jgi:mono/diheme cytochrome c family protein